MFSKPSHPEIDHHTIKLIVGVMAISLAALTSIFSEGAIESISASYHEGGWARDIFVGFLFAISAFLLAYNGRSRTQMLLSKVAAFAAMGIALFPCACGGHREVIPYVHGVSAAVMFLILAVFCYTFYRRARDKARDDSRAEYRVQASSRAVVYAVCGITIVASILVLAIDHLLGGAIGARIARLTFYGEFAGLVAFGIAWLVASRVLPGISGKGERISIFR